MNADDRRHLDELIASSVEAGMTPANCAALRELAEVSGFALALLVSRWWNKGGSDAVETMRKRLQS